MGLSRKKQYDMLVKEAKIAYKQIRLINDELFKLEGEIFFNSMFFDCNPNEHMEKLIKQQVKLYKAMVRKAGSKENDLADLLYKLANLKEEIKELDSFPK